MLVSIFTQASLEQPLQGGVWRSLRNAPPLDELLTNLLQFLANQQTIDLPLTSEGRVALVVSYLQQTRYLAVLGNFEAILESGIQAGGIRLAMKATAICSIK